jgi:flavin reductase (DIM6/NTAB) family NADH-FMN oxidoreductase RutF
MIINFTTETPSSRYHLLTQTIIPRPIAWVLSENAPIVANDTGDGITAAGQASSFNLAPFSFFNALCSDPPLLVMSIGKKPDGSVKDTRHNITSGRDFVVHIPSTSQAQAVSQSAANLEYGDSEALAGQLDLVAFPGCPVPRVADCHIAYHCRLYDVHEIGPQQQPKQQAIIYAEVVQLYMSDAVAVAADGRYVVDAQALDPLARLGLSAYAALGHAFNLQRP